MNIVQLRTVRSLLGFAVIAISIGGAACSRPQPLPLPPPLTTATTTVFVTVPDSTPPSTTSAPPATIAVISTTTAPVLPTATTPTPPRPPAASVDPPGMKFQTISDQSLLAIYPDGHTEIRDSSTWKGAPVSKPAPTSVEAVPPSPSVVGATTTPRPTPPKSTPASALAGSSIDSKTGQYKTFSVGLVDSSKGKLGGAGCYDDLGQFIVLIDNTGATDPTYSQLVNFLTTDKTDRFPYTFRPRTFSFYYGKAESHVDLKRIQDIIDGTVQPGNPNMCGDYAERLHNNAEMAGIRGGYVSIDLSEPGDPNGSGLPSTVGHAFNVFQTTDRGLVYVDATNASGPFRSVATVKPVVGQLYVPRALFPEVGWSIDYNSMGTVTRMEVIWDGTWNGV